ncbi:MAG: hypothetical protein ACU837_14785 [Gammaproteobacteria bacterium]
MSEAPEKMSTTTLTIIAVFGFFAVGFILVGTSEKSDEEKQIESMVNNYRNLTNMASKKCPEAIKKNTGVDAFFPTSTNSDKQSYITMVWKDHKEGFKEATCTFKQAIGGISELVIDGKTLISK